MTAAHHAVLAATLAIDVVARLMGVGRAGQRAVPGLIPLNAMTLSRPLSATPWPLSAMAASRRNQSSQLDFDLALRTPPKRRMSAERRPLHDHKPGPLQVAHDAPFDP